MRKISLITQEMLVRTLKKKMIIFMFILPIFIGPIFQLFTETDFFVKNDLKIGVLAPIKTTSINAQGYKVEEVTKIDYTNKDYIMYFSEENKQLKISYDIENKQEVLNVYEGLIVQDFIQKYPTEQLARPIFDENKSSDSRDELKTVIGLVTVIVVYTLALTHFSLTANEIVRDRNTKLLEIIFTSVSKKEYFIGKIIGANLLLLINVILWAVTGYLSVTSFTEIDLSSVFTSTTVLIFICILVGSSFCISLSVIIGALARNLEDVGKYQGPFMLLIISGYLLTQLLGLNQIELLKSLAFVPFWTPLMAPYLIVQDLVSPVLVTSYTVAIVAYSIIALLIAYRVFLKRIEQKFG
ncbi:MAG: ABC transporter permease [Mycoplasmatales bacterium]